MIVGSKVTNPGDLRTPVVLGARSTTVDAGGFEVGPGSYVAFEENSGAWAKWVNVHGSEAWSMESLNAVQPATVLIRFDARIDQTCGIQKGGVWFDIVSLDNIGERGEYLELKVKRAVSG